MSTQPLLRRPIKGTAGLYVRDGVDLEPVIYGGAQERGLRGGTENVALAVALGAAADLAAAGLAGGEPERIAGPRGQLRRRLTEALPGWVHLNGPLASRLPDTLNISIDGCQGHQLLQAVPGIAASTGSACHAGNRSVSPVLTARLASARRWLSARCRCPWAASARPATSRPPP